MLGTSLWFCSRCRCANSAMRDACAVCGTRHVAAPAPPSPPAHPPAPAPPVAEPLPERPPRAPALHLHHEAPPAAETRAPEPGAPAPEPWAPAPAPATPPPPAGADACPVCVGTLASSAPGERRCTLCGGSWVDPAGVARLFAVPGRDLSPEERRALRARFAPVGDAPAPHARTCPVCGVPLHRRLATATGPVAGDVCVHHGVWLSREDRETLGEFLDAGGLSLPGEPRRKKSVPYLDQEAQGGRNAHRLPRPRRPYSAPFEGFAPGAGAAGSALEVEMPRHCPACKRALVRADAEGVAVLACGQCGGRWVPAAAWRAVTSQAPESDPTPAERSWLRARYANASPPLDVRPPLSCPECGAVLTRRLVTPYGPVRVDLCRAHGVWFDAGELELWAEFVRAGGAALPPPPKSHLPPELLEGNPSSTGAGLLQAVAWLARHGI